MKLLFFASDFRIGLSDLLVEELKFLVQQPDFDLIAVAGHRDQSSGLSELVAKLKFPIKRITGLDEHQNFPLLAKEVYKIIKDEQCEIIHVQNNWQLALVVYIKFRYRKIFKIIYTIHGYRHNQYFKSIFAKTLIDLVLLFTADIVFAPTAIVRAMFPFVRHKCHILFLGVEERYFNSTIPDFRQLHKNIIFAGQFRHGKNQKIIIDALSLLYQKTGRRDFILYLPGDGLLRDECIKLADNLDLSRNIVFPGQLSRDEMFELYRHCQVAIIPTNYETFGHCIAEPYVLGLCVITRNVGIAQDIIIDSVNGLFFEDENDLALLLEQYLNNCDALERIGKKAFEGREVLRWNLICGQYTEILRTKFINKKT